MEVDLTTTFEYNDETVAVGGVSGVDYGCVTVQVDGHEIEFSPSMAWHVGREMQKQAKRVQVPPKGAMMSR
ncbi:hypothetical protein HMPREF2998_00655 [Corynebacterium sp. HMSC065A05]|uniref:hypothetical protein n=1 Tax=Corynebacterium sp. HMSC065A05 TaxID=1739502 RepID=UPI0008A3608F|nr:hypothetical protein [Corynebacterium sp. HMSC065A05]OFP16028.1 hypothetical protein HMPREF2998_00655 [Corynebacterium sp. HMSC065A05]